MLLKEQFMLEKNDLNCNLNKDFNKLIEIHLFFFLSEMSFN